MMKKNNVKVALVTDSLFKMAGGAKVIEALAELFPQADIFTLFTSSKKEREKNLSEIILSHKIYTSGLNKTPFLKKIYRFTLPLWPFHIEKFDFSNYDIVISSSWAVSQGVITPLDSLHIAYVNTPMRYIWDMYDLYFKKKFPQIFYREVAHYLRIWDVSASSRADVLIANSNFAAERIWKYWRRKVDNVIFPPVNLYDGDICTEKKEYFVAGAPFEPNKGGEFLLECAKWIGFDLKIIGSGGSMKKFKRKYKDCKNIKFLSWVSEEKKYETFSKARGYILMGVEEYGIFPVEAVSCGTPVLAYAQGGVLDTVREGENGVLLKKRTLEDFKIAYERFLATDWDYREVSKSLRNVNSKEDFKKKFKELLVENGVDF